MEEPHHFSRSLVLSALLHLLLLYWLSPALGDFFLSFSHVLPVRETVYVVEGVEFLTPEQLARSAMALATARGEGEGMPEALGDAPRPRTGPAPPITTGEPEASPEEPRIRERHLPEGTTIPPPAAQPGAGSPGPAPGAAGGAEVALPVTGPTPTVAGAGVDMPPLAATTAAPAAPSPAVLTGEGRLTLPVPQPEPVGQGFALTGLVEPDAVHQRDGAQWLISDDTALGSPRTEVERRWMSPSMVAFQALIPSPDADPSHEGPVSPYGVSPADPWAPPATPASSHDPRASPAVVDGVTEVPSAPRGSAAPEAQRQPPAMPALAAVPATATAAEALASPAPLPVESPAPPATTGPDPLPPDPAEAATGPTPGTPPLSGPVTTALPATVESAGLSLPASPPSHDPLQVETGSDPILLVHDPLVVGGGRSTTPVPVQDSLTASPSEEVRLEVASIADDKARLTPTLRTYVAPEYPQALKGSGMRGFVAVRLRVNLEGQVIQWEIANWQGDEAFVQAVVEVVEQWRFTVHPAWALAGQEPPTFTVPVFFEEP